MLITENLGLRPCADKHITSAIGAKLQKTKRKGNRKILNARVSLRPENEMRGLHRRYKFIFSTLEERSLALAFSPAIVNLGSFKSLNHNLEKGVIKLVELVFGPSSKCLNLIFA